MHWGGQHDRHEIRLGKAAGREQCQQHRSEQPLHLVSSLLRVGSGRVRSRVTASRKKPKKFQGISRNFKEFQGISRNFQEFPGISRNSKNFKEFKEFLGISRNFEDFKEFQGIQGIQVEILWKSLKFLENP